MSDPGPKTTDSQSLTVTVHAARLEFDGKAVFDDMDFTLAGGRWTCVLGPSGVGKTSLLRLIAGLTPATSDTEIICDDGRPLRGRAAYMAQQDLLLPWLSLIENATLGHRLRGGRDRPRELDERARALLQRVGLDERARDLPATCSGGMRQRAAIVRTLMEDRPVVLMDEPFSALDAITRLRLQELAAELLVGRTVLLVTHDPLEALRLGHRIHVMAGAPARLDAGLDPGGATPRDVADPAVLERQGELLNRLLAASEAT